MKIRTLLILLSLMTAVLLSGCFGSNEDAKIRGEFVKGCLTSGLDDDTCKCAFDEIEEHYGMEKLRQLKKRPYDIPEEFNQLSLNSMLICAGKKPMPFPQETTDQNPASSSAPVAEPEAETSVGEQDISTVGGPKGRPAYEISPYALTNRNEGKATAAPAAEASVEAAQ